VKFVLGVVPQKNVYSAFDYEFEDIYNPLSEESTRKLTRKRKKFKISNLNRDGSIQFVPRSATTRPGFANQIPTMSQEFE